jgi:ABC-type Zn2+ transport system substrate-binding protein/surface adhesin
MEDMAEQYEQNKKDLYEQLDQKDRELSESFAQLTEARKEITGQ